MATACMLIPESKRTKNTLKKMSNESKAQMVELGCNPPQSGQHFETSPPHSQTLSTKMLAQDLIGPPFFLKRKQKTKSSQLKSGSNQFETPEQSKRSGKLNSFILRLFATGTNNYSHPAPPTWDTNCQHMKGKMQKKYTQYLLKYEQSISPHRGFFS